MYAVVQAKGEGEATEQLATAKITTCAQKKGNKEANQQHNNTKQWIAVISCQHHLISLPWPNK